MLIDEALVRANAAKLAELHARIQGTYRSRSSGGRQAWEAACKEFHERFDELSFPGGETVWQALMEKRDEGIAAAILFLEVDPYVFRSGYLKKIVWQKLKQTVLSVRERDRIESVARGYLAAPIHREFWDMVRYVRLRGSSSFWANVEALASQSERTEQAIRAGWLMLARRNNPVRNQLGYEMLRPRWEPGAVPERDLWLRATRA